jgi:hypothetical protein
MADVLGSGCIISLFFGWSDQTKYTITETIYWLIVPAMNDNDDDCGEIGGMNN